MHKPDDKAVEIAQQRIDSNNWMENAYYAEWLEVVRNYKCFVAERKDADGKVDPDKTHIGMPDTWSMVNRRTARITAATPQIGFIANQRNAELEFSVANKCMWDWDHGKVQRWQPKHVRQGELFGWSVRSWYWEVDEFERRRGVDISDPLSLTEEVLTEIAKTYKVDPQYFQDPQMRLKTLTALQAQAGRRGLLDVEYTYKAYEGPRSDVLFVGDCFPEPYFESIQTSDFITVRRRNKEWLDKLVRRFKKNKSIVDGYASLMERFPNGTPRDSVFNRDQTNFRDQIRGALGYPTTSELQRTSKQSSGEAMWTITERWRPGRKSTVAYVAEDQVFLGEMPNPYILDGKIPFTEMILCDDILGGVGDSVARITRGLQQMHNVATNRRFDLYRALTQPFVFTNDRSLYDNPEILRRDLMRLVYTRGGQNSVWMPNESSALAAMASTMGEEASQQRMMQMASGDSNMSMAANVDPSQVRTATGARLLQANNDVLSKALNDAFLETSVKEDIEIIYLLNRSEMADAVEIDASIYDRNYNPNRDTTKEQWIKAEPLHFQMDGRLTVKQNSTLADDDETNVAKAQNLLQLLGPIPTVNTEALVQDVLIAHGKGAELSRYMNVQPPPPPPPPLRGSLSISVPFERLGPAQQMAILTEAGVTPDVVQESQQIVEQQAAQLSTGMPPPMTDPMQEQAPPPIDPTNILAADSGAMA